MRIIVAGLLATVLIGCSGGGSDEPADIAAASSQAVVGVVLTDAASDDVEQVIATFTRIEFVGPGGTVVVFDGEETVDLLDLGDAYELFTVTTLAAGSFDVVRFEITAVSIVSEADDGSLVTTPVTLSSSTVDVALPGGFTIGEGHVLFLEVDFDVEKALELMVESGSGALTLHPLIFIEIDDELPAVKFARVHGEVDELTADGFSLCNTQLVSDIDFVPRSLDVCVDIAVDATSTTAFGEDGLPIPLLAIAEGDLVTAVGRLDRRITSLPAIPYGHFPPPGECRLWFLNRTNGDQPPPQRCETFGAIPNHAVLIDHEGFPIGDIFGVDAYVIERGPLGTFDRLKGKATTTVVGGQFDFLVDSHQGIVSDAPILTTLFPETRIFSTVGAELTPAAIQPEVKAVVDSVLVLSYVEPDELRAAFIVLKRDNDDSLKLSGHVLAVNAAADSLTVATGVGDRCVDAEGADVFVLSIEGGHLVSTKVELADLVVDQPVDVFGTEGVDGCFDAQTILADGG
jgi:hypothetical protein